MAPPAGPALAPPNEDHQPVPVTPTPPTVEPGPQLDLYGRPTAEELLEAAQEFLLGPVRDATGGQVGFHAKVAANVLATVTRQLQQRTGAEERAGLGLDGLGAKSGRNGTNLAMAVIREHLARKGLGLHNDLQNESSIVGSNVGALLMIAYGTDEQKADWMEDLAAGRRSFAFGITEPNHGSDATHMETTARRDGDTWIINGEKTWNTGVHTADHDLILARTSGQAGDGAGITAFLVPTDSPGFEILEYLWTFNMPTDNAHIRLTDVRVPAGAVFGGEGRGLQVVQHFFNENRIRQAASSLGAAALCLDRAIEYAKVRSPFGKPLATNQGIQFPIVELVTQCEMLRPFLRQAAWRMHRDGAFSVSKEVSMANYWANRLCCDAADRAMQVFGGLGYSRHQPFEHIYRHHRRYRITEGAEEIQMRRVAGYLFGFMSQQAPKGVSP